MPTLRELSELAKAKQKEVKPEPKPEEYDKFLCYLWHHCKYESPIWKALFQYFNSDFMGTEKGYEMIIRGYITALKQKDLKDYLESYPEDD
jgi:hypothetical protein